MQTIQHTDKAELAGGIGKRNKYTDIKNSLHNATFILGPTISITFSFRFANQNEKKM